LGITIMVFHADAAQARGADDVLRDSGTEDAIPLSAAICGPLRELLITSCNSSEHCGQQMVTPGAALATLDSNAVPLVITIAPTSPTWRMPLKLRLLN